ncbi:glutathione S-transferase N-terminal domain-containing protein [Caballeronia sp. LZ050]|uniref:glutathione S-transferase family protein n=1 Tax=Caballeronia sp. LZ050 TaxID=3038570 RepID=UPI002863EBAD|nr:glutathione S-transferase N-terminal domain-containing protein [Caballeronia sp. LZ050]MDR5856905.1 glutathione S-transferase N-terminal domain-containing protein [Caballeronia sp. LZ050]
MILIGQYDSPFVRRVAIALRLYDMPYEHRPWSVFGDADKIAPFNPLIRVPTLVLDSGDVLIESAMILDYLDEEAGPERAMIPPAGATRRHALKVCALATGLADKAVALVYERVLHREKSQAWVDRCTGQVERVLDVLEADRAARPTPFWYGDAIGQADIAVACALRFAREAHPQLFAETRWPSLIGHADRCETLPVFSAVVQPFNPPK